MSLLDLQTKIKRALSERGTPPEGAQRELATTTRVDRAQHVTELQDEVHRLQHQIADLSQSEPATVSAGSDADVTAQISALQVELVEAQHALAKLQGRV